MRPATDLDQVLILPGLGDSEAQHWQTLWMSGRPGFRRVEQTDWVAPRCSDWVERLEAAVQRVGPQALLVAHSAACALVAHWVSGHGRRVRGALLVGPSDPEAPSFPVGPSGFAPMPLVRLPFASTVVASTDDPYLELERAELFARSWGSRFVNVGRAGHINTASGLGSWPAGLELLGELNARGSSGS